MQLSLLATETWPKNKSEISAASILNFSKSGIMGRVDDGMLNIYLSAKFDRDASMFIGYTDMAENINLRCRSHGSLSSGILTKVDF